MSGGGGGGGGVLSLVSDRDAPHRPSTRNATRVKKGGRNYTFCPILVKNRGRNTTFCSFLLKYRGRNSTNFQRPEKGGPNGGAYIVTFVVKPPPPPPPPGYMSMKWHGPDDLSVRSDVYKQKQTTDECVH